MIEPRYDTLGAALAEQARQSPDKVALIFGDRRTSFGELDRLADRIAANLCRGGHGGGVVGILGRNSDRYGQLLFGCARAGALALTMNWRSARPELEFVAADARLSILFFDAEFAEEARNLKQRHPELTIVSMADEASREMMFADFAAPRPHPPRCPEIDPEAPALVLYTSGSTGRPKGVVLSQRGLLHNLTLLTHTRPPTAIRADDIVLVSTPLFHVGALCSLLGAVVFGATSVILADAKVSDTMDAVEQHGVTRAVIAPVLMPQLIEAARAGRKLTSLKRILYGMSAIPEAVLTAMVAAFDCTFIQHYGLTEGAGGLTELGPADHFVGSPRMTSCGRPLPDVGISIRRPDGTEASVGEAGELFFRSASALIGYWRNGRLEPALDQHGWRETGDVGYRDEAGYVFLCDRKKDMIVTGGENVYSVEVEAVISGHPDVERVAVIAVPSDRWGEEVKAVIIPKPGSAPKSEDIIAFARASLAGYKLPKSIDFVAEMPVTSVGKIAKNRLREPYWRGMDRQIN